MCTIDFMGVGQHRSRHRSTPHNVRGTIDRITIQFFTNVHVQCGYEDAQASEQVAGPGATRPDGRPALAEVHEERQTVLEIVHLVLVPVAGEFALADQLIGQPRRQTVLDHPFPLSRSNARRFFFILDSAI